MRSDPGGAFDGPKRGKAALAVYVAVLLALGVSHARTFTHYQARPFPPSPAFFPSLRPVVGNPLPRLKAGFGPYFALAERYAGRRVNLPESLESVAQPWRHVALADAVVYAPERRILRRSWRALKQAHPDVIRVGGATIHVHRDPAESDELWVVPVVAIRGEYLLTDADGLAALEPELSTPKGAP